MEKSQVTSIIDKFMRWKNDKTFAHQDEDFRTQLKNLLNDIK